MTKLVAATYGDALFELAVSQNQVDSIYEEALAVLNAFEENEELGKLLNHPKVVKEEKIKVIENVFGQFVSKEITGFLVTIVEKDRSREILDIFTYFVGRIKEYKKIGIAYVATPMELSKQMKDKIEAKLLATTDYKSFEMNYNIDESIIGGMVIRIGDRVIDSSIRHKLDELSRELVKIDV